MIRTGAFKQQLVDFVVHSSFFEGGMAFRLSQPFFKFLLLCSSVSMVTCFVKLAEIAEMNRIGLKNRSILAQWRQIGSLWLGFWEIDLIFRSKLAEIAEMDTIGLKNRSNLAEQRQIGTIWLGF